LREFLSWFFSSLFFEVIVIAARFIPLATPFPRNCPIAFLIGFSCFSVFLFFCSSFYSVSSMFLLRFFLFFFLLFRFPFFWFWLEGCFFFVPGYLLCFFFISSFFLLLFHKPLSDPPAVHEHQTTFESAFMFCILPHLNKFPQFSSYPSPFTFCGSPA